jgi:uncharacterized protein
MAIPLATETRAGGPGESIALLCFASIAGGKNLDEPVPMTALGRTPMSNRLASETSPYLRLHSDDPVDWYAWGEEAFTAAREADKLIFLSIGYASCHWCHVMQRESFKDETTAKLINEHFIPVKVDRESRPDVDELYMAYVVGSTGHGGWPMTVFMTPDLWPIFGGTYFPPQPAYGMPSFPELLAQLSTAWTRDRSSVKQAAGESSTYLDSMFAVLERQEFDDTVVNDAALTVAGVADPEWGGFGETPKFPQWPVLDFLLAYHRLSGNHVPLGLVMHAVHSMLGGGIYDQVGGGLARYAVDQTWLVPHFEKMLYDNAQLLSTLAQLQQAMPDPLWQHAARGTFQFLRRDLRLGSGLYASSLSADTEGEEGLTYTWTYEQAADVLTEDELDLARRALDLTPAGNWETTNVLTRRDGIGDDPEAVDAVLAKLLDARLKRPQPERDDKALVSWNGLLAAGLLEAGSAFDDDEMRTEGVDLLKRLTEQSVVDGAEVIHLVGDTSSADVRLPEDAAALVRAMLAAHATDPERGHLERASAIVNRALELFASYDVIYMRPAKTELPVRPRETHDGATASGAHLLALDVVRLGRMGEDDLLTRARRMLERTVEQASTSPFSVGTALQAMAELLEAGEARA